MKVVGLLLISLALAAANSDYYLSCTHSEMGIRWPSYENNAEYHICHRLGDRPLVVSCKPGEVFTFALQICTSASRFIPAPQLERLPIDPQSLSRFNGVQSAVAAHPPIVDVGSDHHHHAGEVSHPSVVAIDAVAQPPTVTVDESKKEAVEIKKEEHKVPVPPTPAPTPPVVGNKGKEDAKKPVAPLGKKPAAGKKSPSKKTLPKPSKAQKASPPKAKEGKKAPNKSTKKPVAQAKKAVKNP